jgi:hypothetical protein
MRKLLIILLLLLGNSLLDSCATDDFFDFTLDLTKAGNFSMATYSSVDPGLSLAANDYAILVEGNSTILLSQANPSFGGRLLAEAAYELEDKVTNISITSNANLNDNYPAGSELKAVFAPLEIASHCVGNPGASNDCVYDYLSYSSINSIEQAFNLEMAVGFVERGGEAGGARIFALRTNEAIFSQSHVFTIRFDFQSGKSTELITEAVTFE